MRSPTFHDVRPLASIASYAAHVAHRGFGGTAPASSSAVLGTRPGRPTTPDGAADPGWRRRRRVHHLHHPEVVGRSRAAEMPRRTAPHDSNGTRRPEAS